MLVSGLPLLYDVQALQGLEGALLSLFEEYAPEAVNVGKYVRARNKKNVRVLSKGVRICGVYQNDHLKHPFVRCNYWLLILFADRELELIIQYSH